MANAVQRSSPPRLRFSLFALFVVVTLACLALAWLAQPKRAVATSLFLVSRSPSRILDEATSPAGDEREFATIKNTQLALLRSYYVLSTAIRKPGVAALPILSGKPDPVAWLQERLEVEFPHGSEILSISLRAPEQYANDLVLLVDAVATAYEEEVVYESEQRRRVTREVKAATLKKLEQEISGKIQDQHDLDVESKGSQKDTVDGRMRQLETDVLMEHWRELSRSLERDDVESIAPRRIQLIQKAVVSVE
jgi:polysaccharide biosynthesis transport protein